ncbi:hypothetical protein ACIHFE_14100 [Streptomyces sp. NPDC052396]|uniref:hypothetical protein n=1 Tax=Streptomyces sp. NPDC052396 TaxID=3365689 RepID=UPI0037D3C06F
MLDEEQRLALTIAGLLLVGGVLLGQALIGTWVTFALSAGTIVGYYLTPWICEEVTVRRFTRQLRRWPTPPQAP